MFECCIPKPPICLEVRSWQHRGVYIRGFVHILASATNPCQPAAVLPTGETFVMVDCVQYSSLSIECSSLAVV